MAKMTKRGVGKRKLKPIIHGTSVGFRPSPVSRVMDDMIGDLQKKFERDLRSPLRGGRQVSGKLASGPGPAEAGGRGGAIPPSPAPARFRDVKNATWTEEFGGVYLSLIHI